MGNADDLSKLSDRDLDRLLAGKGSVGGEDADRLRRFLTEWKALYTKPPADDVEAAHLRQIAELARRTATASEQVDPPAAIDSDRSRRKIVRRRLALGIVGVAVAAPLFTAGLAVAGVSLPDVVRAPFDEVGVTLPNQSQAEAVRSVIDSTPPDQRDCAFGQEVAAAAGNGPAQPHGSPCDKAGGNGTDEDGEESAVPGNSHNQSGAGSSSAGQTFGQSTAADTQQNASQDGSGFGERTSEAAEQLGQQQSQAGQQSEAGQETGQAYSQAGQESAQEQSLAGQEQSLAGQATGQSYAEQGQSLGAEAAQGHGP